MARPSTPTLINTHNPASNAHKEKDGTTQMFKKSAEQPSDSLGISVFTKTEVAI